MLGKLLREVDSELMDGLIQATKDGDHSKIQALYTSVTGSIDDDAEETDETESDSEMEVRPYNNYFIFALAALINSFYSCDLLSFWRCQSLICNLSYLAKIKQVKMDSNLSSFSDFLFINSCVPPKRFHNIS